MADNASFTIKKDDAGSHVVANRAFKPGDLIFTDAPFAFGPKSEIVCLGCCASVDGSTLCVNCLWPICSPECESLVAHSDNECQVFAKSKVKFEDESMYESITPLRVLLAKDRDPKRWEEEVEVLNPHNEERKGKPMWEYNQTKVVNFLRGPCKLEYSEELIHTVCGLLEVHGLEAESSVRFYPRMAAMAHKCVSNIQHTINPDDFSITVRTTVEVPENSEFFHNYAYSLWPTLVRREYLSENKHIDCKCQRCQDKTELRSHLGTLKCNKCDNGIILSTDPLSFTCDWKCTHCDFKTNAVSVKKVYDIVQAEIDSVATITGSEGIEVREAIYRKYRSVFHPKSAYMTMLRISLTQLYGRAEGYTIHELPDILHERKLELCYQLLEVLDVVEPGYTKLRGITLYELHAPLINLAKNEYSTETITKKELREKMEQAVKILKQSVEILKNELPNTNEGQLAVVAQQSYDALTENFELLLETA